MLRLLRTPCWSTPEATFDLPATVPGWVIAFLALQSDWITRERMAAVFWPDAGADEALNNLRANLHRARRILQGWNIGHAMQAERRRVRLQLPTDVAALDEALTAGRWHDALNAYTRPLLDGMGFPGFPALQAWADLERAQRHGPWRALLLRTARQDATSHELTLAIAERLLDHDELDEDAMQLQLQALQRAGRHQDAAQAAARHATRLRDALGLAPSPALHHAIAATGTPPEPAPPRGGFVGRAVELGEIGAWLARPGPHLLTLLGPGGIGKSRLARQLMHRAEPEHPAGCHWIDLQGLATAAAAADRLAHALGVAVARDDAGLQAMVERLAGRRVLVVLDNAEAVADLATLAQALHRDAPTLDMLVTSRQRLGVPGEQVRSIEGLPVPDAESRDAQAAAAFDAVRLFDAAARAARPDFRLQDDIDSVVAIVERLGGMPLAIELAASWLRLLPAREIARSLHEAPGDIDRDAQRAAAPARPEHASLQRLLERTWDQLAPDEQQSMQALSVFDGGFTLASARAVAGVSLPRLSALVDGSMLAVGEDGRFAMHPVTLAHARQRARVAEPAEAAWRQRHAEHFADLVAQTAARDADDPQAASATLDAEWLNAVQAWDWAARQSRQDLLWRAAPAWRAYFAATGRTALAVRHFALAAQAGGDPLVRARLQMMHAGFLVSARDPEAAAALALEAQARAARAGEVELERECVSMLGTCRLAQGRWLDAQGHLERALAMARSQLDARDVAINLSNLALASTFLGRFDEALARYEQAIAAHRELGNTQSVARGLCNRGFVLVAAARWRQAEAPLREAMRYADDHGVRGVAREAEFLLATVLVETGCLDDAQRRLERLRRAFEEAGQPGFAHKADYYLDRIDGLRGDPTGCVARLLRRYRMALDKGWPFDQLYIAIFVAEQLGALNRQDLAGQVAAMVRQSPHAGAFGLGLMQALGLEPASGVDTSRVADELAASAGTEDLLQRLQAAGA